MGSKDYLTLLDGGSVESVHAGGVFLFSARETGHF